MSKDYCVIDEQTGRPRPARAEDPKPQALIKAGDRFKAIHDKFTQIVLQPLINRMRELEA